MTGTGGIFSRAIGIMLSNAFAEEGWEWVLGRDVDGDDASEIPPFLSEDDPSEVGVADVLLRLVFFGVDEGVDDDDDDGVLLFRFLPPLLPLLFPPCFFGCLDWSEIFEKKGVRSQKKMLTRWTKHDLSIHSRIQIRYLIDRQHLSQQHLRTVYLHFHL